MAVPGQGEAGQGIRGRVAPRDAPPLQLAGTVVALYALAAAIWIVYEAQEAIDADSGPTYSFKALYDPREFLPVTAQFAYEWAFLVAALLVGLLALGRRRVARGGLALLAALLIGLGLRELIGIMASEQYRDALTDVGYGKALLTFRFAGLALGCVLWAVVVRTRAAAGTAAHPPLPAQPPYPAAPPPYPAAPPPGPADAPPPPAYAPYAPYGAYAPPPPAGRRPRRPGLVLAGVALLLSGLNALGWLIYWLTRDDVIFLDAYGDGRDLGDFFRNAVDSSHGSAYPYTFHYLAMMAAALLIGVLLLSGNRTARGAGLALAPVSLYLDLRGLVPGFDDGFDAYFDSTVGTWALLTTCATIVLAAGAAVALLATREE
ncbi:hypothetical protein [Streptomyces sp. NPDC059063]|uniref:hypothetical protein n=1 Tax=unclassified Streptomyces TaxID=2593676 RepID=UPI0036ADCC30